MSVHTPSSSDDVREWTAIFMDYNIVIKRNGKSIMDKANSGIPTY